MTNFDVDKAFEFFKKLAKNMTTTGLSETDSRVKVIDPIFKDCLGWSEDDIKREEHVHKGFVDYIFSLDGRPSFVLEAKKVGNAFLIPLALNKPRYKISGVISTDNKIKGAIDQAHEYSIECGTKYGVVTNGHQFIIFESFKHSGKWREGYCLVFNSLEDIEKHFSFFLNVLSRDAVSTGSLKKYVGEETTPLDFKRVLDFVHNEDASCGKNVLAGRLDPLIKYIFKDITNDSQIEVLEKCYVRQKQLANTDSILKSSFDRLPHYAKKFDINWFKESESESGEFQLSFERCSEFLRNQAPAGSVIMLLGGIGSGKTTFVHHFFKITQAQRDDILWFHVDFGVSPPDIKEIEDFILDSIVQFYRDRLRNKLEDYLKSVGLGTINATSDCLLTFFTMLRYKGYTVTIFLDNVDQHSYTSPLFQERVFEIAQNLAFKFKTILILTLREESFFRSTRSGVLDAYHIPKYHIESPNFEELIRQRINFTLEFLAKSEEEKAKVITNPTGHWEMVNMFFTIVNHSIRKERRVGRDILRFINDVSGGNMRQALRFIDAFMTSGNTDVDEMINVEANLPPGSAPEIHYQIPLHHIIKSIVLEDHKYYSSSNSNIMNLFQVNPQYTNSHFTHLRILKYLHKRVNYFVALDNGFIDINQIVDDAEIAGINQKAIKDSLKKLAHYGLVEFDNQNKEGLETAIYVRITRTGVYYFEELVSTFAYLDLVFQDTPICDPQVVQDLRKKLFVENITDKRDFMEARFERTDIFLKYLREREEEEFENNPEFVASDFTQIRFMDEISKVWREQIEYIRGKLYS
jgi:hypothetical protein